MMPNAQRLIFPIFDFMRRIFTVGESIYDIIFRDDVPVAAKAGGAMLNTSVSLGRLGMQVHLISEYADDDVGRLINSFLRDSGVNTDFVYRYAEGKTAISLAFLDDKSDAHYTFYKNYPKERFAGDMPHVGRGDILLFGGLYSLMPGIRSQLVALIRKAKDSGAMIIYDPNIRSPHKDQMDDLREYVYENISLADLVRASDEDFITIMDIAEGKEAHTLLIEKGCNYLVYTKSNERVEIYSPRGITSVGVGQVEVVSTIGAGDSFNAGLIYELFNQEKDITGLSLDDLGRMVQTAISFGSHVCTHYDNYISEEFVREILATGYRRPVTGNGKC